MAGIKISELPEASSICGNELVPIVQGSCTKFVSASAIGGTGADNIASITTGCGLVGGGTAGSINISMDNNCFDAFVGTHSTLAATSACWDGNYTTVQSNSGNWDQSACAGLNCVGDIEGLCAGVGITGGGSSGTVYACIDAVCNTAWNGTTTTVAANSATWGTGGSGGITGFNSGGDGITIDASDTTSVVVEVDSTVVRTSGSQTISGVASFTSGICTNTIDSTDTADTYLQLGATCFMSIVDGFTVMCLSDTCTILNVDGQDNDLAVRGTSDFALLLADTSANNVGIGMGSGVSPSYKLDVNGDINSDGNILSGGVNIDQILGGGTDLTGDVTIGGNLSSVGNILSGGVNIDQLFDTDSAETPTISDVSGTSSTFGSSILHFGASKTTYGPVAASVQGNYYKPNSGSSTDELAVTFYSDAAEIEMKIERSQSSIQFYVDDVPVHEFAVAGYNNRLLKISHSTAKIRKYEVRGKSYGFGGVYTNDSVNAYQVWPYETRKERPLLMVMTDSYGTGSNDIYGLSFVEKLADMLDMDLYSDSLNSSGWSSTGATSTSTRSVSQILLGRAPDVILACLGYNDKSSPNQTNIEAGINNWHSTITGTFASANIMLASPWTPVGVETNLTTVSGYISGRATALAADFIDINGIVTADNKAVYTSGDNTHPSAAGHEYIARRLEALMLATGNVPTRD